MARRTKKNAGGAGVVDSNSALSIQQTNAPASAGETDVELAAKKKADDEAARLKLADEYKHDFKRFYCELLASNAQTQAGRPWSKTWGRIHDLLADLLCLGIEDVKRYTDLRDYVKWNNGALQETWVYWPVLTETPQFHTGPEGHISEMYYKKAWHGVIVRLKGDLTSIGVYLARGHLKSEIATKAFTLWLIVRDPARRHIMLGVIEELSESFAGFILNHVEHNAKFKAVFGNLKPEGKGFDWDREKIQVAVPFTDRRGDDPTITALGVMSEITGKHADRGVLDDVVTEKNTQKDEQIKRTALTLNNLTSVLVPGSSLIDIGTPWDEEDAHSRHTKIDAKTSFMTATVIDANPQGECIGIGPAGPGNPLWPEVFSKQEIQNRRDDIKDDRFWYGQYFCQFHNSTARLFRSQWIQNFGVFRNAAGVLCNTRADTFARKEKLAIFGAFVTGLGKLSDNRDGSSDAAAVLIGQKLNGAYYLMDGFCESLALDKIAQAVLEISLKWRKIAEEWDGHFRMGSEVSECEAIADPLARSIREKGLPFHVSLEKLKHTKLTMQTGIRNLQPLYMRKQILWPGNLMVESSGGQQAYSLLFEMEDQLLKYPSLRGYSLLTAMAYAVQLSLLPEYKEDATNKREHKTGSEYFRDEALGGERDEMMPSLGGFDDDTVEWGV